MLPELVFATNNKHKTEEIGKLLVNQYKVLNLKDIGCDVDIPETGNSFAENAELKSSYVTDNFKLNCFADDSGLEIAALDNEPGIYSARYSGVRDDLENLNLVLKKMEGKTNRKAHFKTVISLNQNNKNYLFEGVVYGNITQTPIGDEGFGYDPIFMPIGYDRTFAQMSMTEKNEISHRAIAMKKLIAFLKEQV
ncbi:RdgB/HAM1 family non-canonical purine NTP pyrophosphatase [Pedobacter panaciterrae]